MSKKDGGSGVTEIKLWAVSTGQNDGSLLRGRFIVRQINGFVLYQCFGYSSLPL